MTETIGQYEIKSVLGGGGMATVYRGEHVSGIGMIAAVKKLHPHLAVDAELRARLKVEAQALARLKHRNIVQILDYVDLDDGTCALITELVEGRTLRAVMAEFADWPMPLSVALTLFRQILEGVGHAHRNHCLHRDLKPGNIMVTHENEVKVLDFGIANLIDTEAITRTGVSIGTPVYMAPEQLDGRRDLDQRADLYSLGMTLWEMLAGHGARPIGQRGWRLSEEHIESLVERDVPVPLIEVVRKLVQVDREERFFSCEEVQQALSDIVDEGCLDEESTRALTGVGPAIPPDELPTFEFNATQASVGYGPITQTVVAGSRRLFGGLTRGKVIATALVLLAVAADLSQLIGEGDEAAVETSPLGTEEATVQSEAESGQGPVVPADPARVTVLLSSDPPGASLRFEGEELGRQASLKDLPAEPRDYLLTARLSGYKESSLVCRVGAQAIADGSLRCVVELERLPQRRRPPSTAIGPPREAAGEAPAQAQPAAGDKGKGERPRIHKID